MIDTHLTRGKSAGDLGEMLQMTVFTGQPRPFTKAGGGTLSPVTSTVVYGRSDAVLVDAQHIREDVDALADVIDKLGRRLTTVFITHGHPDHYFGAARIAERFQGVDVVAAKSVAEYIGDHVDEHIKLWGDLFREFSSPDRLPMALPDSIVWLEGRELEVIEVGQGDIAPSTVLRVPEIDALIVGDVAYNQIHQNLSLGGPAEWFGWIASIERLERLNPRSVVTGHKKAEASDEDVAGILGGSRSYIRDFAQVAEVASTADEIVEAMTAKYPNRGNVNALVRSAAAVIGRRA